MWIDSDRKYEIPYNFDFQVSIYGDTLIQRGEEEVVEIGVKKYIIETYLRVES